MQELRSYKCGGHRKFFRLIFNDSDISSYYGRLWELADNTNAVTLGELENMLPFEIDIYTGLLIQRIKRDAENRRRR